MHEMLTIVIGDPVAWASVMRATVDILLIRQTVSLRCDHYYVIQQRIKLYPREAQTCARLFFLLP